MFFKKLAPILLLATLAGGSAWAKSDRDGSSRIAFIQGPDVYTMNPDGTNVTQLTNLRPNSAAFWLAWSADAKQLAFQLYPPNAPPQIWIMNADGTNQHLLLTDTDADWSPSFRPTVARLCSCANQASASRRSTECASTEPA